MPPGLRESSKSGLPLSLLRQSSRRLQVVCAVAASFLVIYWLIANRLQGELAAEFQDPAQWAAPAIMLTASLVVLVLARSRWLSPSAIVTVGLIYMVVFSFCIPLSEYYNAFVGIDPQYLSTDLVGLSGVAIWMLFFTVLVPSKPRHALIALTLSGSAVPITVALLARYGNAPKLPLGDFADIFIGPYVFVVLMSYIAARIIYRLGTDISRARELGSYRLLDPIGRGGMGEVWRAKHNMLARPAAVKLIRRDLIGSEPDAVQRVVDRFEREAQVTASLESPHTVDLYDYGISDDGSFYYVMELLEGVDLESLIERCGPLPAERVIHILRQVCQSLGEAHRRDLIHRDIKPSNIFLCQRAFEHDFVKVLDFGLVKPGREVEPRSAGLHRSRVGRWGGRGRRAVRYLLAGLCGVLAADRPTRIRERHGYRDDRRAHQRRSRSARYTHGTANPFRARLAGDGLSGEGPCRSAGVGRSARACVG